MAPRRGRAGPVRTPVHEAASEYRYSTFMSLTDAVPIKSKESLIIPDAAPSEADPAAAELSAEEDGLLRFDGDADAEQVVAADRVCRVWRDGQRGKGAVLEVDWRVSAVACRDVLVCMVAL